MYRQYVKRFALCILGLALYGFGCVLGVKAGDAGTNAWSTLALGFGAKAGLSYGTATFLISLVIITIDLLGKGGGYMCSSAVMFSTVPKVDGIIDDECAKYGRYDTLKFD